MNVVIFVRKLSHYKRDYNIGRIRISVDKASNGGQQKNTNLFSISI